MNETQKKIAAASILAIALVALGVAVVYAYNANTRPTNPYGAYSSYGPYGNSGPNGYSDPYTNSGPYSATGPYGSYGQWGGRMGGGMMGGYGMGMMR